MKTMFLIAIMAAAAIGAEDKALTLPQLQSEYFREANEINSLQAQFNLSLSDSQKQAIAQINQKLADLAKKHAGIEDACKKEQKSVDNTSMNCVDATKVAPPVEDKK